MDGSRVLSRSQQLVNDHWLLIAEESVNPRCQSENLIS